MLYVVLILAAYLLGSIPFGWLLVKLAGRGDIRHQSSGSTGATNVARTLGLSGFIATWFLDMAKSFFAVWLGTHFVSIEFGAICGLISIIGHCFPVWLKFHGGKGNSSMFGALIAINPIIFATVGIEWLLVAATTGYSSFGAIIGFLIMPVLGFAINCKVGLIFIAISLLCLYQHRENIKRLINGTESKMQMSMGKLVAALVAVGLILVGVLVYLNV